MTIHVHAEYVPPKSWEQFEELCADTFSAEWSDPNLMRHGRAGQRQHGVDIVARRGNQWPVGLQCKKKSRWPVSRLTVADIDTEVAAALKFRPKLKSFYILTTAPDDERLQKHARMISTRHKRKGLFEVILLGWSEIVRRATLHEAVAVKHFGPGGGAPEAPLLATWFTSDGRLELTGEDLAVTCRELTHEFRDHPAARIVIRKRESDDLVAKIAAYDGRPLTMAERKTRLELRDKLATLQAKEARLSLAVRLMLADPAMSWWIFNLKRDSGDGARPITSFVNHEFKNALIDPETIKIRLFAPRDSEIYHPWYITEADVASITALREKRDRRFGHGGHTNTVTELPDQVRGAEAIPAVISEILHQLDEGRSLEDLRKNGMLDIGDWRVQICY